MVCIQNDVDRSVSQIRKFCSKGGAMSEGTGNSQQQSAQLLATFLLLIHP